MVTTVLTKIYRFLDTLKFLGLRKAYYISKGFYYKTKTKTLFLKDIFHPLLTSRFLSCLIIDHFNGDSGHNVNKSKDFLGFGLIHYAFIRNIKPERVLCVGSRKGFIPAILALACKDNKKGQVDFVDLGLDSKDLESWSGTGWWRKFDNQKHFNFLGINKYLSINITSSKDFAKKFSIRRYDYIYIDGNHSYNGVKLDYQLFWPMLKKNGFMVFHDVIVKEWKELKNFGVWKFWKEIDNKNKITFPFPEESGLGILQKMTC